MKIFWSYAKKDDIKPHHVTELKECFKNTMEQCNGDDVEVFQDTTGLPWGCGWREKLESEVKVANAFVCILSPSYFNSKNCIQEVVWAIESNIKIYPLLYRECPKGLESKFADSDKEASLLNVTSKKIVNIQYVNFTSLRNSPKNSSEVMDFLDKFCSQIEVA